ncbi:hypothetical protein [Streptomyces sp. 4F14]|uniref:hypothetical protein n=1 Tax=Streptomyces sp. 4F14 TaxID=3394380 RepID=UPI003A8769A8
MHNDSKRVTTFKAGITRLASQVRAQGVTDVVLFTVFRQSPWNPAECMVLCADHAMQKSEVMLASETLHAFLIFRPLGHICGVCESGRAYVQTGAVILPKEGV